MAGTFSHVYDRAVLGLSKIPLVGQIINRISTNKKYKNKIKPKNWNYIPHPVKCTWAFKHC